MTILTQTQLCPYCGDEVDDSHAEWEEGTHEVECDGCGKEYSVSPQYKFLGFEVEKICQECSEIESECYCDIEEVPEDEGEQVDLFDIIR